MMTHKYAILLFISHAIYIITYSHGHFSPVNICSNAIAYVLNYNSINIIINCDYEIQTLIYTCICLSPLFFLS